MSEFTKKDNELIRRQFELLRADAQKRCADKTEYEGVLKAFEFANEAHKGVRRRSGEPYILHPIAVARIVVEEIGLGYKSIVAALVHDVVEDTDYTIEDIERLFGAKIASLVDGLTKIKSAMDNKVGEPQSIQAENFKRILLTLNDDVRVILIKLADRLHNLRTIDSMPERKKDKILSETMYIFIPLAHRLGLNSIKSEMENIWLQYRQPQEYKNIKEKVERYIAEKGVEIDKFIEPIEKILLNAGYKFTISKRIKTPYSIWNKMRTKGVPFDEIYDLFAVRIVFTPKEDSGLSERRQCFDIYSMITEGRITNPDRLRDMINNPKPNGYEALHCTIMSQYGGWVEVQIRSERMDAIAEKGVAAHWKYKGGGLGVFQENEIDKWLNMVRGVLENPDINALEFLDLFHSGLLSKEIYVFTPQGESKRLPKGSTALDYAYYIHSHIGNTAIAAKVNMKLVPLSHVLQNGDQVVILTAASQKPQLEWLNFVHTAKAKNIIYDALKSNKKGQKLLNDSLAKIGIKPQKSVIAKLMREFNVNTKDELYNKIGAGIIRLDGLEAILSKTKERDLVNYWTLTKDKNTGQHSKNIDKHKDYLLKENPDDGTLSYKIAECCRPIPGDPVIGFEDDNHNVVIHKKVCTNAMSLATKQGGKIINVKWTTHEILSFLARIEIHGVDRMGIVTEITQYITQEILINMRKIFFETHDGVFFGHIDLYVHDIKDLEGIINKIASIKGIDKVARIDIKEGD